MERILTILVCLPFIYLSTNLNRNPVERNNNGNGYFINYVSNDLKDLNCAKCHASQGLKKKLHATENKGCVNCHRMNPTDHPEKVAKGLFLTKKIPSLCFVCHDSVRKFLDTVRFIHRAVNEKKQCMNCHSPHSSDEENLLTGEKKELCLSCHDKEVELNGKRTKNIRLLLSGKVIHKPLKDGCTDCHDPHASSTKNLLIKHFPVDKYVPAKRESYALCWKCHNSDLMDLSETTTTTNFRNGAQNLHHVHLSGTRGRSCVICHDAHASNNKFLIVDKVPFTKWSFMMNFEPTVDGGSCSPGCHGFTPYKR